MEKEQNTGDGKIDNRGEKESSNLSLQPLSLCCLEPPAAAPFFLLVFTSCTARDHHKEGRILLTERMKNRGRKSREAEERRRRITTVCHHSRLPQRQRHRDQHCPVSFLLLLLLWSLSLFCVNSEE